MIEYQWFHRVFGLWVQCACNCCYKFTFMCENKENKMCVDFFFCWYLRERCFCLQRMPSHILHHLVGMFDLVGTKYHHILHGMQIHFDNFRLINLNKQIFQWNGFTKMHELCARVQFKWNIYVWRGYCWWWAKKNNTVTICILKGGDRDHARINCLMEMCCTHIVRACLSSNDIYGWTALHFKNWAARKFWTMSEVEEYHVHRRDNSPFIWACNAGNLGSHPDS